jgi:hypothetical protein
MGCKQEYEGMIKGGTQEERKDKKDRKTQRKREGSPERKKKDGMQARR